ncbi:hypothetical protein Turpa_3070 [Turneriella parva DSM 21527]|uniref:Uncharacterized protein n=2 Tax=Turneriella TaxID=338321 RepID=I4B8V2_TURPD|nr:hypothetical protein Turpa_3070 [Turneriella parva DSM 21527]
MIEGRNDLNPHDKYRRVHLVTGAGGQEGAAVKHLTYVLDTPGKTQNSDAQRECDRLLFQQLNVWAKTGTEPLHLAMEASCRQVPYGLTRQVREQM